MKLSELIRTLKGVRADIRHRQKMKSYYRKVLKDRKSKDEEYIFIKINTLSAELDKLIEIRKTLKNIKRDGLYEVVKPAHLQWDNL